MCGGVTAPKCEGHQNRIQRCWFAPLKVSLSVNGILFVGLCCGRGLIGLSAHVVPE